MFSNALVKALTLPASGKYSLNFLVLSFHTGVSQYTCIRLYSKQSYPEQFSEGIAEIINI